MSASGDMNFAIHICRCMLSNGSLCLMMKATLAPTVKG